MGLNEINQKINDGINFIIERLKNFSTITTGEQISYVSVFLGIILMIVGGVLLFIGPL